MVLALVLLDFPYRVIYHAEFDTVRWEGRHCYLLGEREDQYLLFCPDLQAPRNRIVGKDAPGLQHVGARENIFSHPSITKAGPP